MSKSVFSAPHFNDEAAAYAYVEARLWKGGRVCPHCGIVDRSGALKGKTNRIGLYKCYVCRKPFTVKVGTIFEDSHIAMRDWLTAMHLICSSKKGISSNQLARTLGITLKSAWFMSMRIREALKASRGGPQFGHDGGDVEVDETYFGRKEGPEGESKGGWGHKHKVLALVERGGRVRSFYMPMLHQKDMIDVMSLAASECAYRQVAPLPEPEAPLRQPPDRGPWQGRICAGQGDHQHRRRRVLHLQARDDRHLPALQRTPSATLSGRVRLSLLQPR
jgi:transposase-like protein